MGVVGTIVGVVTFPLIAPVLPVPKEREVQGVNACEMDLATCHAELAVAQEEVDVWQRSAEFCTHREDGEVRRPRRPLGGCPTKCQECFDLVADVQKTLTGADDPKVLSVEDVQKVLKIKNNQSR
jgi:hypothetical protein